MPVDLAARRLKTFFVGKEPSRSPLVPQLQALGRQIVDIGLSEGQGFLSARNGKRVLINTGGSALASLKDEDFIEIVDYDAQKNRCMIIGSAEPSLHAGVHWLIYSNREEIGGIVQLQDPLVLEVQEATQMFPETKDGKGFGSVELAVEALKVLRKSPYLVLRGHGVLAVGKSVEEALEVAAQARAQAVQVVREAEGIEGDGPGELDEDLPPPGAPRRR